MQTGSYLFHKTEAFIDLSLVHVSSNELYFTKCRPVPIFFTKRRHSLTWASYTWAQTSCTSLNADRFLSFSQNGGFHWLESRICELIWVVLSCQATAIFPRRQRCHYWILCLHHRTFSLIILFQKSHFSCETIKPHRQSTPILSHAHPVWFNFPKLITRAYT